MNLAQLEAFQEVVRAGSFRRAAKGLFLSHPALSERVRRLEAEVGQLLFHRDKNRISLTPAGRAFRPYAQRALEIERQAREAVATPTPALDEPLKVAATPTLTAYFLPGALAVWRKSSAAPIDLTTERTGRVFGQVLRQEVEIGLLRVSRTRSQALTHPEAESLRLFTEPIVLVVHPWHPFAGRKAVSLEEAARQPLVLYQGAEFYALVEGACNDLGVAPNVLMRLDGVEGAKRMVLRGLGTTFVPWTAVQREVAAGTLVRVPLGGRDEPTAEAVALLKRGVGLTSAACGLLSTLLDEGALLALPA
jgi:DNA-binding transcriptional LysR family regulator